MARSNVPRNTAGMSLLEVVLAIAIFAAVIGVTAQSLASFYVAIDLQEQRINGLQAARAVMSAIRERRDTFQQNFPDSLIAWVSENNDLYWDDYLVDNSAHEQLRNHSIQVDVFDLEGNAPSSGESPVQIFVRSTWLDRRNRPIQAELVSVFNDQ